MFFKVYIDEAGKEKIQEIDENKRYSSFNKVMNPSFFPELSEESMEKLNGLNHYIKKSVVDNITNFDNVNIYPKDEQLKNTDFKIIFNEIFSKGIEIVKKCIFLNDKNELVNLYEGSILSINPTDQKISFNRIPGYEILHNEKKEEHEYFLKSCLLLNKNQVTDHMDYKQNQFIKPHDDLSNFIMSQYLSHINKNLTLEKYPINNQEIVIKALEYLIDKEDYTYINNIDDFNEQIKKITEQYNSIEIDPENSFITNGKSDLLGENNLFSFFENMMLSLFSNKENNKFNSLTDGKISYYETSSISSLGINTKKQVNETLILWDKINNHFEYKKNLFKKEQYLLMYKLNRKEEYQIHKLTYEAFLNNYLLDDNSVNLALFNFISEMLETNEKCKEYIENLMIDFTKGYTKPKYILCSQKKDNKNNFRKSIRKFNEEIDYPLNVLKILYDVSHPKKIENFVNLAIEIHSGNEGILENYDFYQENILEKLFNDALSLNKTEQFFKKLIKDSVLNDEENLFYLTNILNHYFLSKNEGSLIEKISLMIETNNVNEKEYSQYIFNDKNIKDFGLEEVSKELYSIYMRMIKNVKNKNEEDVIKNIKWMRANLNIKEWNIVCRNKEVPVFNKNEFNKTDFRMVKESESSVYSLLNYHLLKGNNKVVLYLKDSGFVPSFDSSQDFSSLECALVGACDEEIIDWICDEISLQKGDVVNIFGFARYKREKFSRDETISLSLIAKPCGCAFSQDLDKKNGNEVLKKMAYLYSKYQVDYNFNISRLYYIMTEENKDLITNHLGLNKEKIEKISYGVFLRLLMIQCEEQEFEKEIKEGRLNFLTDFYCNLNNEENDCNNQMNIFSFLSAYNEYFKDNDEFDSKARSKIFINMLLENITETERKVLPTLKNFYNFTLFEWIMSQGINENIDLIKKLMLDYKDFNINGKMEFKKRTPAVSKSYRELFFSNEEDNELFNKILSDVEKINISKNIIKTNKIEYTKRRL